MRIGRALIIPAVLALSVAGSAMVGAALPVAAATVPIAHTTSTTGFHVSPDVYHHA
jgi:hypothetical protein